MQRLQSGMESLSVTDMPRLPHQPNQHNLFNESDDDDDRPLSFGYGSPLPHQGSSSTSSQDKPVFVRNVAAPTNKARPSRFVKPGYLAAAQGPGPQLPPDMQPVQKMYDLYCQKLYLEGYLMKMKAAVGQESVVENPNWAMCYAELCGSVLSLWNAQEDGDNVMPQYINIIEAQIDQIDQDTFGIHSAGTARYLFRVPLQDAATVMPITTETWISSLRTSCFECSCVCEMYTKKFIVRSDYRDIMAKTSAKMEGFVHVRMPDTKEWRKYWAVVSDRRDEKKLFGKKSVPAEGQLMLFESKKAKTPVMTMVNVTQAYMVYPETAQLIDMATMLKVQASLQNSEHQVIKPTTWALIMVPSTKELVQWIVSTFDAFKLYGRPNALEEDVHDIGLLNLGGHPTHMVEEQQRMPMAAVNSRQAHPGLDFSGAAGHQRHYSAGPTTDPLQERRPVRMSAMPRSQSHAGKMVYASDDSEDEDEDDGHSDDEAESDNGSLFNAKQQQAKGVPTKVGTKEGNNHPTTTTTANQSNHDESSSKDDASQEESATPKPATGSQPRPRKVVRPRASVYGSDSDDSEDEDIHHRCDGDYCSDEDSEGQPGHQQPLGNHYTADHASGMYDGEYPYQQQYPMWDPSMHPDMMHSDMMQYGEASQHGMYPAYHQPMMETEDGPVIPQLGDRFANPNSLLDTYRAEQPSARDQQEYARATGQPLIQIPNRPPEPRAGLVGMISQIEHEKKEQNSNKGRLLEMEKERLLERERERYLMEQRQQMMQKTMPSQSPSQVSLQPPTQTPSMSIGMNNSMGMSSSMSLNMGMNLGVPMMDPRMSMMPGMGMPMMDPRMSMMHTPMMDPRMSMMPGMGMPMMDPRMSMMPGMGMPMMDPRMTMMQAAMMQGYPMLQNPYYGMQGTMPTNNQDDDDEDDDVPLGSKAPNNNTSEGHSPLPSHRNHQS
ncbi:uncharacterized protein BYT42DRAFT_618306 [Radiomyces spectabilis]|uniref:uncharacterized protein n=1 Tax=Radiomyces spectabilis TaxID=64574 RepID=UPI00221E96C1|nr:uncharacterized protein BYT42DRAFT_618306 [Radiomyces spectabilis]KAI8366800.1 hypothetical protein BYT42DRAFT_618306 [Radiomyces spectabilis]